jgi:hypothetical protein
MVYILRTRLYGQQTYNGTVRLSSGKTIDDKLLADQLNQEGAIW